MKRLLTIVSAALISAGSFISAAQGQNEISVYMGVMNAEYTSVDINRRYNYYRDLYALYEPNYDIGCYPTVTLDYNRRVLSWMSAGVQANWALMHGTGRYVMESAPETSFRQHMVAVLPQAKFYIPGPKRFRPYAKVGLGIGFSLGDQVVGKPVTFAWDIAPIGFEWGSNTVYAIFEASFGNVITGMRFGIGYRF